MQLPIDSDSNDTIKSAKKTCCAEHLCLTDFVRKHYVNYLERQLLDNINAWSSNSTKQNTIPLYKIKECIEALEQRAINACMVSQLYQRTMVKIIATVRRATQECRLERTLYELLHGNMVPMGGKPIQEINLQKCFVDKTTQTETKRTNKQIMFENNKNYTQMSLDEKIDLFQTKFNQTNMSISHNNNNNNNNKSKQKVTNNLKHSASQHLTKPHYTPAAATGAYTFAITPSPATSPPPSPHATAINTQNNMNMNSANDNVVDDVARALAEMFEEENNDLDDIFGLEQHSTPDDPQIVSILKEIENAKLPTGAHNNKTMPQITPNHELPKPTDINTDKDKNDLCKSLWPCELYMQRRTLNATLCRLVDEDLRWQDIMKWKFEILFGDDSDDEFAVCSPSIDLDDVLMASCIKRITPWLVHQLMKPWNDGLIANRFLFKKLAKKLAEAIIVDNQYPNELYVKRAVEYYFCVQHAVSNYEDLEAMPRICAANLDA